MPTSDSEDFESADEGQSNVDKKERKSRLSSSNYSDNTFETELDNKNTQGKTHKKTEEFKTKPETEGWDDFDIDDTGLVDPKPNAGEQVKITEEIKLSVEKVKDIKSEDTGWDDFDDWGHDDNLPQKIDKKPESQQPDSTRLNTSQDIKGVTESLAETNVNSSGGWGWGWGVDSLLSTATAGISTITSQVSQGISTVLETGLGAPDPEELARKSVMRDDNMKSDTKQNPSDVKPVKVEKPESEEDRSAHDASFPFGSLISGVTKFVETTGTKVIAGGLDTLETIGKKTMEVLQDGDPGLAKKRAMLGLEPGEKPVLSQVLREAKTKADEEDRIREEKREAKEIHYENLFDDYEGLVHLEALEMLSKQVNMRIEERMRGIAPDKRQDVKETLQQVAELCEMPEEEDDDEETPGDMSKWDVFHERLQTATQDIGIKMQFQPLVKQYTELLDWLSNETCPSDKTIYKRAVSGLAQATALSVEIYHKTAEMLLVKTRRSTADEADALTQMTSVLTKHVSDLATLFTEKLNSVQTDNKEQINTYITNVFLEAGNSSTYIQNAFQLALPILQIGAV